MQPCDDIARLSKCHFSAENLKLLCWEELFSPVVHALQLTFIQLELARLVRVNHTCRTATANTPRKISSTEGGMRLADCEMRGQRERSREAGVRRMGGSKTKPQGLFAPYARSLRIRLL